MDYFVVLARNCLAATLDYIVMQMRKTNIAPCKPEFSRLRLQYSLKKNCISSQKFLAKHFNDGEKTDLST